MFLHDDWRRSFGEHHLHCTGSYGLTEQIVVRDKPITVRGDGIGVSKVVWAAHAKSSGLVIIQVRSAAARLLPGDAAVMSDRLQ